MKKLLKQRKKTKKRKPEFKRQESYRKNLKDAWRRPRGKRSKLRMKFKPKGRLPTPCYGSPALVRGKTRDGFIQVIVKNTKEMEAININEEIAIIGRTVGQKKRLDLIKIAKEKGINYR